jgi:glycosidase
MTEPLAATTPVRPVIYQLLVRTFGNTNETCKPHGTLAENGCGKFNDINDRALTSLREMGFTHLWLTGVLAQVGGTAAPNCPADDPRLVKGSAGSPYAIRDYFDVCPDYAVDPERRLAEFQSLIERCRVQGLGVIIDFVPNHVARCYHSTVRPGATFGVADRQELFFERDNHFYYLGKDSAGGGPPLRLPLLAADDPFYTAEGEHGRVSGNNVVSWAPAGGDWYETVKLNYGHDFTQGPDTSGLPGADAPLAAVPRTWRTMDEIIRYWQALGVAGFRVDMAHLVPMEFWAWALKRARLRQPDVLFYAEAYDNDPAKLTAGQVLDELLMAGFDAVYDDPAYDLLEGIYTDGKWANDLDVVAFSGRRLHQSLRYGENHDEVRLANPAQWGGHGWAIGRPVCAVLFAIGRGPVMVYQGQEVGEAALSGNGYAGDNARSSIFDYGSLPELCKWVNAGRYDGAGLDLAQRGLREWYAKLIAVTQQPVFTQGEFYGLNHANLGNPDYGRVAGETVSGHWLYGFLRYEPQRGRAFLVMANFHPSNRCQALRVIIPEQALQRCGASGAGEAVWHFSERLATPWSAAVSGTELSRGGLRLPLLEPLSAMMLEIDCGGQGHL